MTSISTSKNHQSVEDLGLDYGRLHFDPYWPTNTGVRARFCMYCQQDEPGGSAVSSCRCKAKSSRRTGQIRLRRQTLNCGSDWMSSQCKERNECRLPQSHYLLLQRSSTYQHLDTLVACVTHFSSVCALRRGRKQTRARLSSLYGDM